MMASLFGVLIYLRENDPSVQQPLSSPLVIGVVGLLGHCWSMQLRSGWRKRVDDERSTGVNLRTFSGLWSTVKTLSHMSYLIGGTGANQRNLSSARSALFIVSASWPFRDDLVGAVVPNGRRPFLTAETFARLLCRFSTRGDFASGSTDPIVSYVPAIPT
jgi:hypothetical protein